MDASELDELQQQAKSALAKAGYAQLSSIQVEVSDDEKITLRGEVSTFYMKQLAQTVTRINGCRIDNRVKVIGYSDVEHGLSPP